MMKKVKTQNLKLMQILILTSLNNMVEVLSMEIFDIGFELNRKIALKNREKDLKLPLNINTKSKNYIDYTNSNEKVDEKNSSEKVYVYNKITEKRNSLDAEVVSENFERDSRRYQCNLDIDIGGEY